VKIVRLAYVIPPDRQVSTYLLDPYKVGRFWHGIECNDRGVAVRTDSCAPDPELWIREDRVLEMSDLVAAV
jgi:hypothetical protein